MYSTEAVRAGLPRIVTPLPGPRARAVMERDAQVLSPSYTRCYPLVVERGEGCIVEDLDRNRFLDMNAGIAVVSTGHCHPEVVRTIQQQSAKLIHMSGTDFYYENMVELAEKLAALAPGNVPRRVYFGNSGTEAVEAALKLARYATGRDKFISFFGGFHGRTMGALSLTGSKYVQKKGFGSLLPGVYHALYPDPYRQRMDPVDAARHCLNYIEDTLFRTVLPPSEVAGIIVEPVQGEGGYLIPHREFFAGLRDIAQRHGILLIADEVQSGVGRTGRWWASEHFDFIPDILTSAKGIASGLPLGAMIASTELMTWKPGAHASTFGGNPVAVAASLTTLRLIEQGLLENARSVGDSILERARRWPRRFRHVGEVRGLGLMVGIEIVADSESRDRAPALRDRVEHLAFEQGVLVLGAGPSAIRLSPPLILTHEQASFALDVLEACFERLEKTT